MKKLVVLLFAGIFLPLAAGEVMNLNSSMELGVPGKGAPAYYFDVNKLHITQAEKSLNRVMYAVTDPNGKNGNCIKIPGYSGVAAYMLEVSEMILPRDGEVEITFDAKIGPDENGVLHPAKQFTIDFRCFPDLDKDKYYPMLKRYNFRPTTEWKTFKKRFNIKGYSYYYHIWVMSELKSGETANALYLDNLKLRYVDGKDVEPEEYAVIPDQDDHLYAPGKTAKLDIRARLNGMGDSVNGTLVFTKEYNSAVVKKMPVTLKRDANGTYVGKVDFKVTEFGSFTTELVIPGKKLRGVNGSIISLHKAVKHPRGSFGWRMGFNQETPFPSGRSGYDATENLRVPFNSMDRAYRILSQSGCSIVRVWAKWRALEAYEGQFIKGVIGCQMSLVKKYGFEPLFCLVGNFPVHGAAQKMESYKKNDGRGANFPRYLWKYYYQSSTKHMGSILPPMEDFKRYMDFVYKTWGKDVRYWEMSNEPGILGVPADKYIGYLKYANKYLKDRDPNAYMLGNGVTGDFGMNVVKWCEQLNAADSNYVDHLDAVAFHPYACGLDYYNGSRDLYKQCVKNISGTLAKPKPMWNTECYYLPRVRDKQMNNSREFSRFGSNELQRHYLDGFCNNVMGSPSFEHASFFQRTNRIVNLTGPTELVAAGNALSFLLKDMVNIEELAVNRHVRAGVFTDKAKRKAMGFIYDMRPAGSIWSAGKANVKVLDLYGNQVKSGSVALSYEPYYISGTYAEVVKALKNSAFKVASPVELYGRFFGDNLFVEARNTAGTNSLVEGTIGSTPVTFDFSNNSERTLLCLGKVDEVPAQIKVAKRTPAHKLPYNATLAKGSKVTLSIQDKYLKLTAKVAERDLKPAEKDQLWAGSAVELFIDPEPFFNQNVDKVRIMQYVFSPIASTTGVTFKAVHNRNSKASCSAVVDENGYVLTALIPLSELPKTDILGIDVTVGKRGVRQKEGIGDDPGNSYRRRGHYHLFRLSGVPALGNCDFSASQMGDPEYWCYVIRDGVKVNAADGVGVIEVSKNQKSPACFYQQCSVTPGKYKRGTLQVKVKYENLKTAKTGRGRHGLHIAANYRGNSTSYGFDKMKKDITGSADWQILQMDFKIPAKTSYIQPHVGIGVNTTGKVTVDGIKLFLWEK